MDSENKTPKLSAADHRAIADGLNVSTDYVQKVLRGDREQKSRVAKNIVAAANKMQTAKQKVIDSIVKKSQEAE